MINPNDFIITTEKLFQLEHGAILNHCRLKHTALARHIAMYLVRKHSTLSLHELGIIFKRDHSCVVNACNIVNKRLPELSKYIETIEAQLAPKKSLFKRIFS